MIGTPLLILVLVQLTSAFDYEEYYQAEMCRYQYTELPELHKRWPIKGEDSIDDSTLVDRVYYAEDGGALLNYPPGVGYCGGKYPIWIKESRADVSVMCIQNETSTCFKEIEVETDTSSCPFPTYRLQTDVVGSAFCFQPNGCFDEPCKNGGTCTMTREGISCSCLEGFSGPTCEGDPCKMSTMLSSLDKRQAADKNVSSIDRGFQSGWYEVPRGMVMLDQAPTTPACSSKYPVYTLGRIGNMIGMCSPKTLRNGYMNCSNPRAIQIHECEGRNIYALKAMGSSSVYCFECNEGPLDILIIEDVSSSVEKHDNDTARNFAINFVTGIDVSKEGNNVAYITFASKPHVEFYLNAHDSQDGVLSAIRSQVAPGGGTNLDPAVKLGELNVFREQNGDRPEARNVVLLITDGKYKDGGKVNDSILELRRMAEVFVVTVTPTMDTAAVMKIASDPTANHVYPVDKALRSITTMLFDPCDSEMPV